MGIFNLFKHKSEPETAPAQEAAPVRETTAPAAEEPREPALTSLSAFTENAAASASGLYPHEILMLHYAPTYHPEHNRFQKFWADLYGVCFPQTVLDQLLEKGFIAEAGVEETVPHLTMARLKELLEQFGLSTAGKKADMIRRLLELEDRSQLEAACPERYFVRTEKGEEELRENWYVAYLHSHRSSMSLSIWDASKLVHRNGETRDFSGILLETLRGEAEAHRAHGDFGRYRNACLAAYTALTDAGMAREAFHCLCETAYYDLSGLGDGETALTDESPEGRKALMTAKLDALAGHFLFVVPSVKQWFLKEQADRALSDEALRELLLKEFGEIGIPFHLFSDEECADILLAVLHDDADTPARLLETAKSRLREELAAL